MNSELFSLLHLIAGSAALLTGLIAMSVRKKRGIHTVCGILFHITVFITAVTASILAFKSWDALWWLFVIAVLSYVAVLLGHIAARIRWRGWLPFHIICQCSCYISITTAFLVVNRSLLPNLLGLPAYWSWIIPTVIGTPLIAWTVNRYDPKRRQAGGPKNRK